MSERITRKDLRQDDPFHQRLVRTQEWVRLHKKPLWIVGGAIVAIALFSVIVSYNKTRAFEASMRDYIIAVRDTGAERSALEAQKSVKKEAKPPQKTSTLTEDVVKGSEIRRFQNVVEKHPRTEAAFYARLNLAQIYYNDQRYGEAEKLYLSMIDSAPTSFFETLVYYGLGYSEEALKKYEDAVRTFERAAKSNTPFYAANALMGKARCEALIDKKDAARKTYEEIRKRWPNSAVAEESKRAETLLGS